ncbi:sensor domain-containing diguanylate cyclase [Paenibacillus wulumuqiensis]|uniref:sensor domain-containing diguanylate cyclase n=1 Tax=Paenibacillus wulumuqiensis TaxID=1567107 RepID=UPI000619F89E|nr:sensor domain-containing diguanylate cyclase [Paenibacillus wulumuqiensis]
MIHITRWYKRGFKLSTFMCGLAFLTSFLILLSCLLVSYTNEKNSLEKQTLGLNENHAKNLSRVTNTLIQSMQHSLKSGSYYMMEHLYLSPSLFQDNLDYFHDSTGYFNAVFTADENGLIQMNSPTSLGQAGTYLTTPASKQALAAKKPIISSPYMGKIGKLIILVSHPLFTDKGQYKGMLGGVLYLQEDNRFKQVLGTESMSEDGSFFYVIDRAGNIIYHPDTNRINQNISQTPIFSELKNTKSGNLKVNDLEGHSYLAGYAVVPDTDWRIVVQSPSQNIKVYSSNLIWSTMLYLLPIIAVLLAFILWISLQLSLPLNSLAEYARNLAIGKEKSNVPKVSKWNYEAKQLHQAIMILEEETREKERQLKIEANVDPLTGLLNRRALQSIASNWSKNQYEYAVVMLDIDHFKSVNDKYGHPMGDEVLKMMARILRSQARLEDLVFRYGGEEFAILLYEANENEAMEIAERIRQTIEIFPTPINKPITISLGISLYKETDVDYEGIFNRADEALYKAKQDGRNCTRFLL